MSYIIRTTTGRVIRLTNRFTAIQMAKDLAYAKQLFSFTELSLGS